MLTEPLKYSAEAVPGGFGGRGGAGSLPTAQRSGRFLRAIRRIGMRSVARVRQPAERTCFGHDGGSKSHSGCKAVATTSAQKSPARRRAEFAKLFQTVEWCPGAESNHRHCDFQSRVPPFTKPLVSRNIPRARIKTLIISSIFIDATRRCPHTRGHWSELIVRTQCGHEHESRKPQRRDYQAATDASQR